MSQTLRARGNADFPVQTRWGFYRGSMDSGGLQMIARRRVLAVVAVVALSVLLIWAFSGWNQAGPTPSTAGGIRPLSAADADGPSTTPKSVAAPVVTAAGTGSPPPAPAEVPIGQLAPSDPPTSVPAWPAATTQAGGPQPAPALPTAPGTAPTSGPTTAQPAAPTAASPSTTPIGHCTDRNLDVLARTDAPVYPMGHTARFDLIVVSLDREPCVRDIGRGLRELIVMNLNGTRMWSSNDCSYDTASDPQILRPNEPMVFSLTWQARTSHPRCSGPRQPLGPGTYQVSARLGARMGGGTQFTLGR